MKVEGLGFLAFMAPVFLPAKSEKVQPLLTPFPQYPNLLTANPTREAKQPGSRFRVEGWLPALLRDLLKVVV